MTQETKRKIEQAIAECFAYIAKEEPRAADLRPADVAQHLAFCKSHVVKLQAMLQAN